MSDKDKHKVGNCGQTGCENKATHEVFWPSHPGVPMPVCERCKNKAVEIAKGLGFDVGAKDL